MTLEQFIRQEKSFIRAELIAILKHFKPQLLNNPQEFTEFGADEPTIDIRLCVDLESHGGPNWILRTGSVDFDSYHSEFCSASCIGLDTKPSELLNYLLQELDRD
jgi:hypothetical protein